MTAGRATEGAGVALACNREGLVTEVISDGLGAGARLAPGSRFAELCDADCETKAETFLEELRRQGAAFGWELVVRGAGGELQALHFAGAADQRGGFLIVGARSRAGVARAYEELIRINNELAAAQRELAKKNAELARLNEQKNRFLGLAAHDLRNPLDVINVYSRFLIDEAAGRLDDEQLDFVRTIMRSSNFMLALVEDLLDVSKIEAGRLELELTDVDLRALVGRNVELNRRLAERKEINILFKSPDDIPSMRLDASKIEQVLNNLVGNAVKFSPRGGAVEVGLEREGADGPVLLYVKDEGPGVSAENLEGLFEPFTRARARGSEGEQGTGLGLAIVKRIVEGHGGRIGVESEPGAGATFAVSLPAAGAGCAP